MTWLLYGTCPEGPRRGLHQDDRSRPSFGEPYQKSLPALPIGRQGSPQAAQASRSPPTAPSRAWTGHRRVQIQVFRGKRSSVYPGEGRPLGGRWVKTCPAGGYTQSPLPRRTGPAEEPEQGARGYLYPGGWGGWREAIAITDAARLERLPVVESGPRRRRSSPHWHDCCATVKGLTLAPRRRRTSVPIVIAFWDARIDRRETLCPTPCPHLHLARRADSYILLDTSLSLY
ncbi:hypothetical protein PsYK624_002430 [Phanerochaete sordida]|uniref:Uncharacterized protein n=1 Tax=Phanerochaete sordida TaxID=48140 RepID=A0A9P3FX70_9APHY|nr:hypothetical protein PsYK624_002430 [Phanerochaete sordida]